MRGIGFCVVSVCLTFVILQKYEIKNPKVQIWETNKVITGFVFIFLRLFYMNNGLRCTRGHQQPLNEYCGHPIIRFAEHIMWMV